MKHFLVTLLLCAPAFAKSVVVTREHVVTGLSYDEAQKLWRVELADRAAAFWAPASLERCLREGRQRKAALSLRYDVFTSQLEACSASPRHKGKREP